MKPEEHISKAREHIAEALKSHEGAKELDTASTLLLLATRAIDSWREKRAEHRNGGLGAPLSDERTMGGGSGGSDRESLTSGQPGALVGDGGGR